MHRTLLPALLLLAACAGPEAPPDEPGGWRTPPPSEAAAHDLTHTETFEIRFGDELVGYLVEVLPMPADQVDERAFKPGTTLIEDKHFAFLGFISPSGTTYRFDEQGEAHTVGWGSRNQSIAAFFRRNGAPRLLAVTTGQPQG